MVFKADNFLLDVAAFGEHRGLLQDTIRIDVPRDQLVHSRLHFLQISTGDEPSQLPDLGNRVRQAFHALAELSNGLRNVPSTTASTHSKELIPDVHFATFLKIFSNKQSSTSPITASGVSYTNAVQNFATKWQAGNVKNLGSSLADLDKQLDAQVKQAKGGGPP